MRTAATSLITSTLILLLEGSAAAACPSWTHDRAGRDYPASHFVVGLGVVGGVWDQEVAEQRAKSAAFSEIGYQLSARVQAELRVSSWEATGAPAGTSAAERVDLTSSVLLRGARIARRCFDPSSGTLFVLATLDRAEALSLQKADLAAANERGAAAWQSVRAALDRQDALAALLALPELKAALEQAQHAADLLRTLGATPAPEFAARSALNQLQAEIARRTTIQIDATDPSGVLVSVLAENVRRSQLTTWQEGATEAPLLVLRGRGSVLDETESRRFGGVVARVRIEVRLERAASGEVLAELVQEHNSGAANAPEASRRAFQGAAKAVSKAVGQRLSALASGSSPSAPTPNRSRAR